MPLLLLQTMNKENRNDERWQLLIEDLREKAILKFGKGWQTKLSEITQFTQSNISRMFGLKYAPNLRNYTILAKAIGIAESEIVNNDISKFLVSIDQETKQMYILHREDPCYLVHVVQELPVRYVLVESYNSEWNDERLLLHPSINQLKHFATKMFENSINKN